MHLFLRFTSIPIWKQINRRLVIAFILGCFLAVTPVWAQTDNEAAIILDGTNLFQVKPSGEYSAQERAKEANSVLGQIDFTEELISVEIDLSEQIPVIVVDGNHLLSVTSQDVPRGRSPQEQAKIWAQQLKIGIQKAQEERQPKYLLKAILLSLGSIFGAIAIMFGLRWLWHHRLKPLWRRSQIHGSNEESSPLAKNLETGATIVLNLFYGVIVLLTISFVTRQFPQTRQLSDILVSAIVKSLTSDIIPLGSKSYSVFSLLILIGLFTGIVLVSKKLRQVMRSRILSLTPLNPGTRETVTTIVNYTFIFISSVILLQLWGLDLSSLTVFAGVLGVGIGFGLQGIAKEFISGIIIIFERPIQVGDFVEVGDFMGTVQYIRVRSTEILTLDQISIIVPNSRFLESEVINWSHGSPISRIKIPVGVAYGSDLATVRTTLIQAAKEHGEVLTEPSPKIIFLGFGDSSVNFNLFIWIKNPEKQLPIKSDIYFRIETMFRHRQIEIPCPQRNLNVNSGSLPGQISPELQDSLINLSNNLAAWLENQSNK